MGIERAFRQLVSGLQDLREALEAISVIVEQDRPAGGEVVVATHLADALLELRGILEESISSAKEAVPSGRCAPDLDRVRTSLKSCQEHVHLFANRYAAEIGSYERMADLVSVGRERGRQWLSWSTVVKDSLERCGALLDAVRDGLFLCWQELAERIGMNSVSVQNTVVGQQIGSSELAERELLREGVT